MYDLNCLFVELKSKLGLSHWDIEFKIVPIEEVWVMTGSKNDLACVGINYEHRNAVILIGKDTEDKAHSLIHELVHILSSDISLNLEEHKEERIANTIASCIEYFCGDGSEMNEDRKTDNSRKNRKDKPTRKKRKTINSNNKRTKTRKYRYKS